MTSVYAEKKSSIVFSNSAYVYSQGKSACEIQTHLYLDLIKVIPKVKQTTES